MNQSQRIFLIGKITEKINLKIKSLQDQLLVWPSASNYIFKAVMNGTLQLQSQQHIMEAIRKKALAAKEGESWLSGKRMGYDKERVIEIDIPDLIIIPADLEDEKSRVVLHNKQINDQIRDLRIQMETLEIRIQLASDKTLQTMINEVDDMGNLSLIDTKLKLLTS